MVAPSQLLEADIDHDPVQPGGKRPFRIEPPYRGEQLHEDLLGYVLCEVAVSDDPIRGAQDAQPVKLDEHFQPRQISTLTLEYGLPLLSLCHATFHPRRRCFEKAPHILLPPDAGKVHSQPEVVGCQVRAVTCEVDELD